MTINSIAKNQVNESFIRLNTMRRVNSAADDAAGLAIMEKMESQIRGLDQGIDNTLDMKNLINTAEGGLSTINDSLQRIRELSIQAANGIYTDEDRALIQTEVNQLIQGIESMASQTEFNNMPLLDGSFTDKNTASYPDGTGATVNIPDMRSLALGLQGYDVSSGSFDLSVIDNAMASVNATRSYLGAMSNRADHTVNSNSITMLNQAAAQSRIADLDVARGINDYNRDRILTQAQIYMQRNQMQNAGSVLSLIA